MSPRQKFLCAVVDAIGIALVVAAACILLSGCVVIDAFRQGVIR